MRQNLNRRPPQPQPVQDTSVERLMTLAEAADTVGAHLWSFRRAVKAGLIASYMPFNSRRLVKLSEVVAFIDASKRGGQ